MFWFKKKEKDLEDRVEDYVDQHGISTHQLNFALWYIRHHKKFFIGFASLLVAAALILWGYAAVKLVILVFDADRDRASIIDSQSTVVSSSKIDYLANVDYRFLKILPLGMGRYDFVGEITNTNEKVGMEFDYHFVVNDQDLEVEKGFVLPGEKKYLVFLGKQLDYTPDSVSLVIENQGWRKINPRIIADWNEYKNERINFIIDEKKFLSAEDSGLSDKIRLSNLDFTATNFTAYNYLEMDFMIVLFSGSSVVGVSKYVVTDFKSREKEQINLSLIGDFSNVDKLDIIPEVNILDEGVFDRID